MAALALVVSLAALLLGVGAFFYLRVLIRRRTTPDVILAEVREEVTRLLRSLDETAERDISVLEDREKGVKALLEEIDRRLKVYTRELDRSLVAERAYQQLGKAAAAAAPPEPAPRSREEKIRALVVEGLSSREIASRLGIAISEVDFAVALMQRKLAD